MPRFSQQQGDGTGAARPFPEDGEAARRQERKSKTFALLALADTPSVGRTSGMQYIPLSETRNFDSYFSIHVTDPGSALEFHFAGRCRDQFSYRCNSIRL
jgi:hypothetical protein